MPQPWVLWGVQRGLIVDILLGKGLVSVTLDEVLECPAVLGPRHVEVGIYPDFS